MVIHLQVKFSCICKPDASINLGGVRQFKKIFHTLNAKLGASWWLSQLSVCLPLRS